MKIEPHVATEKRVWLIQFTFGGTRKVEFE
jgi:hypothetical protein